MLMLSVNTTITVGTIEKINKDEIELFLNIPIVLLKGAMSDSQGTLKITGD